MVGLSCEWLIDPYLSFALCHYESVILSDYRGMTGGIRQDNKKY